MAHITQEQRYVISAMLSAGETQAKIAQYLNKSQAAISKELKRNSTVIYGKRKKHMIYQPRKAQERSDARKERFAVTRKFTPEMARYVYKKLVYLDWSPEQIVNTAMKENVPMVSVERIYQYIRMDKDAGGKVYKHCRHKLKYRKRCVGAGVSYIPNRVSIHERPEIVSTRNRFGDWEMDLIQGLNSTFIVTLVERKTRYLKMSKLEYGKKSDCVASEVIRLLNPYKECVFTITTDNGKEFSKHEQIGKELCAGIYFTDPYSSWQKGTVENTNKLIRQYIPKRIDFNSLTDNTIQQIQDRINNRPRKRLNFEKPAELFNAHFNNFNT